MECSLYDRCSHAGQSSECIENYVDCIIFEKFMERKVYKGCMRMYSMVDTGIRVDDEIISHLERRKLIPRESYKSVLKRLLGITIKKEVSKNDKM